MTEGPTGVPASPAVAQPGRPFAVMLRAAWLPSLAAGILAVLAAVVWRGSGAWSGALLGLAVALLFYVTGMAMLSRLVRSTSPHAFFAIAMTVYFAQIIGLLLFLIAFHGKPWLDGKSFGLVAAVVTVAWQVFSFRALRRGRFLAFDEEAA